MLAMKICSPFFRRSVVAGGRTNAPAGAVAIAVLVLVPGLMPCVADADQVLDPRQVAWTEVSFHASKFLLSADASMRVEPANPANFPEPLMAASSGVAVELDDESLMLTVETQTLGREGWNVLLMNSRSGAAVQFVQEKDDRYRISRYTDIGRFMRTWRPEKREKKLPRNQWSNQSDGLRAFPPDAVGQLVAEPAALIYIIAAAPLLEPGDQYELLTMIRRQVFRVIVEVAAPHSLNINYLEHSPSGTVRRKSEVTPLRLLVRGEGLNPDDDQEFQLLGLQGDIELYLQPETRLPLQLNGKIKILGKVKFRLRETRLR